MDTGIRLPVIAINLQSSVGDQQAGRCVMLRCTNDSALQRWKIVVAAFGATHSYLAGPRIERQGLGCELYVFFTAIAEGWRGPFFRSLFEPQDKGLRVGDGGPDLFQIQGAIRYGVV